MSDAVTDGGAAELSQARATITRLEAEVAELRRRLADQEVAAGLRDVLSLVGTVRTITTPGGYSRLLESIVETAARVISSHAASLFLVDEAAQELIFEVALGQKAEEVRKFRVPLGHGVAGLVAVSGQPMAISDAHADPRLAQDIAAGIDYIPRSILCVPLFYDGQVIGVLELLDREGAPSYGAADMEVLGQFANLAAVAIEQSRTRQNLAALVSDVLREVASAASAEEHQTLEEGLQTFAAGAEKTPVYQRSLALARLVNEVAAAGDHEAEACQAVLRAFSDYLRARPPLTDLLAGS